MIDDHPTVAFAHIRKTEPGGIRRYLAVLTVRKRIRARVHGDVAKNPHVLLADHDANIGALRHVAEVFATGFRSVAQRRRCRAPENSVGFVQGENTVGLACVEGFRPRVGGGRDVVSRRGSSEVDDRNGEQGSEEMVAMHVMGLYNLRISVGGALGAQLFEGKRA